MNTKQDTIAQCALDLFIKNGYMNTPVRDIIDASSFGTSTFYRYYKNKEDVLKSLLEAFLADILASLNDYYATETSCYVRFIETKRIIMERFAENPKLSELYCRVSGINDAIDASINGFDAKFLDFAIKNIEYGVARGVFRDIPADPVAHGILGIIKLAAFKWIVAKEISAGEMIDLVVSFHESISQGIVLRRDDGKP